jgi:hypothetical protein
LDRALFFRPSTPPTERLRLLPKRKAPAELGGTAGTLAWSGCLSAVVLTDRDGRHITSQALLGKDPATLARQLLHETKKPSDFNRAIAYPRLGIA